MLAKSGYITKILKWNFHPNANTELITLITLNVDYKLLSKMLPKRIKEVLNVSNYNTSWPSGSIISNKNVESAVKLICDLLFCLFRKIDFSILKKAFDPVPHEFYLKS